MSPTSLCLVKDPKTLQKMFERACADSLKTWSALFKFTLLHSGHWAAWMLSSGEVEKKQSQRPQLHNHIDLLCAFFPGGEIVKSQHFSMGEIKVEIKNKIISVVFLSIQMYSDSKDEKLVHFKQENTTIRRFFKRCEISSVLLFLDFRVGAIAISNLERRAVVSQASQCQTVSTRWQYVRGFLFPFY